MGFCGVRLLSAVLLAAVGCAAGLDGHDGALQMCRKQMEDSGYECIGSVGVQHRPADVVVLDKDGSGELATTAHTVEELWQASGWGNPEDADAISFLVDGTLCVRRNNSTSRTDALSEGSNEGDGNDDSTTRRLGGRRLSRRAGSLPAQSNAFGSRKESLRRLRQASGPTFDQELSIPFLQERIQVTDEQAARAPFRSIGQVWFGCSGALVGPCHYLTAGHCVFDHETFQVRRPLDFNPGRNGIDSLFPLGRFQAIRTLPSKRWSTFGDPRYDAAIVQVDGRPGDQIG